MPFTLFCHENSPEEALSFLDEHNAAIDGDENNWEASYVFPGKLLKKKKKISFNFDRTWCSAPNWPTQLIGMQNFVSSFEMADARREMVMRLIRKFQFCLGVVNEPEITKLDDPRFDVMHALAEHLGGIFFSPGALLDSHFRPFAASDGECDPEAIMPIVDEAADDEDDILSDVPDPNPPTSERVARRMYTLLAVAARGLLDMNLEMGNQPAYRLDELHNWLEELGIEEELEPHERKIVYTPERELVQQDAINSVWSLEALVVLAWSLRLADLPPYDELVETDELLSALSLMDVPMSKHKLTNATLRSAEELEAYNDQVFAFNWRMVDYRVRPDAIDYAGVDFGYGKLDLSWATLQEGDLGLQGAPIAKADQEVVQAMSSAAMERQRASNWLQGNAALYSHITTDT